MSTPPHRPTSGNDQPDTQPDNQPTHDQPTHDQPTHDRLPCGAPVDRLLDQVSAGHGADRTAHQAGCPHCQAALAEYDRLWSPVRELATDDLTPPQSFLEDTIRRLRRATADPTLAVLPGPHGATRISARVVVVTARETAHDVDGVRVALGKIVDSHSATGHDPTTPGAPDEPDEPDEFDGSDDPLSAAQAARPARDDGPRAVAGVAGRSTAIEITLAAQYGIDLVDLGERIRTQVTRRVRAITGLDPVTVTVVIDDVFT